MPKQEQTINKKALLRDFSLRVRSTKPKTLSTMGASSTAPPILAACTAERQGQRSLRYLSPSANKPTSSAFLSDSV